MTDLDALFPPGKRICFGDETFTAEKIITFARKFDPQIFHIDAEAAKNSVFGGLCASGWHTTATWMKKSIEYRAVQEESWRGAGLPVPVYGPSPGVKNLRWMRPVYAGDTISFFTTTEKSRRLSSRPGWAILQAVSEAENQDGQPVMRFDSSVFMILPWEQ